MEKVKIGVIGLGHNGMAFCERYAKNPRCELTAVCDTDAERLDTAVRAYGAKGYADYGILNDKSIQAISIHTPDHLHREAFVMAMEAGFHVFVEKPMADTEKDVQAMVETYRKHTDKTALVGHILRYDAYFALIKKWIGLGLLGEIFYLEADYIHDLRYQYHMEPWKVETEIPMVGGGCHPLDILRWYTGDAVKVSAMQNHISYREMKADTAQTAIFTFASGAVGKVTSLYGSVGPRPDNFNLSVYGTKGTVVRNKVSFDGMHSWMDIPEAFDPSHDYMPEIDHFSDCITGRAKPLITPADAANTVIAALCAVKSAASGQMLDIPKY